MHKKKEKNEKIKRITKLIIDGKLEEGLRLADIDDIEDLLNIGVLFWQNKAYDVAEKVFDRVIQLNPNLADAWYNKGIVLGDLGKYEDAVKCYDEAIRINPNDAEAWCNKGVALGKLGKYDEAVKCYDEAIKINPKLAETWCNKGITLGKLGKYEDAVKCFDEAIKINPNLAEAWCNKGVALGNLGKYNEAVKCFDEAIKINSKFAEAWCNKGITLGKLGKYEDAVKCFDEAIKINPNYAEAWYNKGVALGKLGKYDDEVKCYDEAIKINPNYAEAWYNKGVALGKLGKYDDEVKCYDEAIKINPNYAEAWYNKGIALGDLGKYDEAVKCFDEAIKINSKFAEAWCNKGITLGKLGKYEDAVKCFDEAIKINPNYDEAWYNKGVALGKLGKYDDEVKCYDEAIKINPNYAEAWCNKGIALGKLGKYDEAVKCYDEAIKINPNYAEAWCNKGVALGNLGKYDDEVKCYDEAIKINPNLAEAWYNKGVALGNLGKYDDEVKCYDEAIKINPNYAEAYGNKGIAFLDKRRYDEAKVEFKKAEKLFSKRGAKKDAEKANKLGLLAENASELIRSLEPLDKQFLISLKSQTLVELREKASDISKKIQSVIKKFKRKNLPPDAVDLLNSKEICFTAISNALKFEEMDVKELRKKLRNIANFFEDWKLNKLAEGVDCVVRFINEINVIKNKYKSLEEITTEEEKYLLSLLQPAYILDGELTEKITKGKPFPAKPIEKKEIRPKIIYKYIADTEEEWIRFCLVQLDFSWEYLPPPKEYGIILKEEDKIKSKVFQALEIAKENKVNVICFPELSFAKKWVNEMSQYKDMIIIGGSYYDEEYNICPIIINGECVSPSYKKIQPSPIENPRSTGRGMKSGNNLFIFQTKYGRFAVLTCSDYTPEHISLICNHDIGGRKGVDFIINPRLEKNMLKHQERCNVDCRDYDVSIIQINKAPEGDKYGKSCIIAKEHDTLLEKYQKDGIKPEDDIKYKLCQLEGETIMIVDLNRKAPPVDISSKYPGRISVRKVYKYDGRDWKPLR